jgi:hypothetical protein
MSAMRTRSIVDTGATSHSSVVEARVLLVIAHGPAVGRAVLGDQVHDQLRHARVIEVKPDVGALVQQTGHLVEQPIELGALGFPLLEAKVEFAVEASKLIHLRRRHAGHHTVKMETEYQVYAQSAMF